ncbi:RhoGEF domain-containing protein [Phellopilus nigrolimitatus]|nr:RhoGEF domain-containing protein [Phellopilus nigrolimitatus]
MFRSTPPAPAASSSAPTATMAISTSPRKVVPLSSGEEWQNRVKPIPMLTKRAFFCAVVVEGPSDGMDLSEDNNGYTRTRALTNNSALADLTNELVVTERNYVQRLRTLKDSYADPLRSYARSKDTAIIAAYEAKILFGNIDQLLPANEAFLHDLEQMAAPEGAEKVGGVGDIALYHLKDLRAFECYKQYYVKREEAQAIFKREMAKKSSTGFAAFVERIKYSTSDPKNRVGLRELLMEPIQRIPRYTLLFRSMIKFMASSDPQRAKLVEADEIASRIALAETDDHTRLAATLNCLASSIDGFPPALISSSRRFIDCIDVEDHVVDAMGPEPIWELSTSASGGAGASLHCTLILFDDKLMLGWTDVERFANGGFASARGRGLASMRRAGMSCKGVLDVTDVVATDVSGADMHLYLESPPLDQTDRWAGRPFRLLSVILPGTGSHDAARAEGEKRRFLDNIWRMQARYRTKLGQSVALCADEQEVESRGGRVTVARTYFNIYQRTSFLKEAKKTKIVLHIDSLGIADPLPFGMDGPPYPLPGELCRYVVHSNDPDDESEEDVVQTARVPSRIVQTIHQYGLFKFSTNNPSRPATPSGGNRSRAHIFGLDAISRNLFGALPGSSRGKDVFGSGSIGSHRRSKSAISRASTIRTDTTGTTTTADSSTKFSSRSNSTAATSMSSFVADEESFAGRVSKPRKLVKRSRSRSPGVSLAGEDSEGESSETPSLRRRARSLSVSRNDESVEYSDHEEAELSVLDVRKGHRVSQSEMDLTRRLELARQNSHNHRTQAAMQNTMELPVDETIYEEEPPLPTRPASRASRSTCTVRERERDAGSLRSLSPHRSITPTPASGSDSPRKERSPSIRSRDRRPVGPRTPSPLPPTSPTMHSIQLDIDGALESTLSNITPLRPRTPDLRPAQSKVEPRHENGKEDPSISMPVTPSQLPRSKRQLFAASDILESTPKGRTANAGATSVAVEPLSIKKKTSTGPTFATPTPSSTRKTYAKDSPLTKRSLKVEDKHASSPPMLRKVESLSTGSSLTGSSPVPDEFPQNLIRLSETTREDLEASRRALKRIKLEVNALPSRAMRDSPGIEHRPLTPSRGLARTPTRNSAAAKEAIERMEEMRAMIGRRKGPWTPLVRPRSVMEASDSQSSDSMSGDGGSIEVSEVQTWTRSVDELVSGAERDVARAASNHELLEGDLSQFALIFKQRSLELERTRSELRSWKRQCELVKKLMADAAQENEILYEAFNEELDGMFKDVLLPADEAWTAMTTDLRKAKEERSSLTRDNAYVTYRDL